MGNQMSSFVDSVDCLKKSRRDFPHPHEQYFITVRVPSGEFPILKSPRDPELGHLWSKMELRHLHKNCGCISTYISICRIRTTLFLCEVRNEIFVKKKKHNLHISPCSLTRELELEKDTSPFWQQ